MSGQIRLCANCSSNNNDGEVITSRGDDQNSAFASPFANTVDANGGLSEKCVIVAFDDSRIRSPAAAESPRPKPDDEGEAENLSSSEAELSDTESTHRAMSLSSPEDGPHPGSEEDRSGPKKAPPHRRSRPRVGSSPDRSAEAEKTDEEKRGSRDEEEDQESKVERDALEQEEDGSEYVMSCNLRGPSRHNVKKAERLILGLMSTPKLARTPEESDEQYSKRVRKHNFLSLAQEFVARSKSRAGGGEEAERKASGEDAREWAKNVKNAAKPRPRPLTLEALSPSEGSSAGPLFLPVTSVLGSSATNQSAIHRCHQRSLAQMECRNAEPANRARRGHADLPANVARMAGREDRASSCRHQQQPDNGKRSSHRRGPEAPSPPPQETLGGFDVYNIETAMPTIDWIAMEEHLAKAAKEEVFLRKHHRNNREEIRRKLAMGSDTDDYYGGERMSRKPSLQARLQSGMNLQICFMNETASDPESVHADQGSVKARNESGVVTPVTEKNVECVSLPLTGSISTPENLSTSTSAPQLLPLEESKDFLSKQARLQAEARLALAQAKQMAHMQMEVEKQRKKKSPIAEMVGIPFPDGRHKVSRHALVEMNVAQLQVIVNDLHTQIENLNEELVHLLMERDDLHMEQDSMLVDIEDLTRYL